jgi:hypothetical protein
MARNPNGSAVIQAGRDPEEVAKETRRKKIAAGLTGTRDATNILTGWVTQSEF